MVRPINSAYDLPTYDNILNQHVSGSELLGKPMSEVLE